MRSFQKGEIGGRGISLSNPSLRSTPLIPHAGHSCFPPPPPSTQDKRPSSFYPACLSARITHRRLHA